MIQFVTSTFIVLAIAVCFIFFFWLLCVVVDRFEEWSREYFASQKPPVDPKYDPHWKTKGQSE
jgi:hypothetical protein